MFYSCVGLTGKRRVRFLALTLFGFSLSVIFASAHFGAAPPGLLLQRTGRGYVILTITNGSPGKAYEIQFSTQLPNHGTWTVDRRGVFGQTNFVTVPPNKPLAFYRARLAEDADGDGVPDCLDIRPDDPRFGLLIVNINHPRNGTFID